MTPVWRPASDTADDYTLGADDSDVNDPVFKAFNDFDIDDMPAQADISRRMLRRLEDIDNSTTAGPTAPAARAALATSVVAHAVVELETQLIELKRQLGTKQSKNTR